jgi:alpha-L-fucosidase 2
LLLVNCEKKHCSVGEYDVIWNSPSENSKGSMPLGNGDIGINVWAEQSGDIYFYIGKTDAWNGNSSLLKIGKVKIHLSPNPFKDEIFEQRLDVKNGEIEINTSKQTNHLKIAVWVDANHPVIHFDAKSNSEFEIETSIEIWRNKVRQLRGNELHTAYGVIKSPNPVLVYPDSVLENQNNEIIWVHRNRFSIWQETLDRQGMGFWKKQASDPLINNTFGGLIRGGELISLNSKTLKSSQPQKEHHISIYVLTAQVESIDNWNNQIHDLADLLEESNYAKNRKAHRKFWNDFWERSWIYADGTPEARTVTQAFVLQRFISACAGRGNFPQKFNGSLFNVDSLLEDYPYDADFRRWGGPYWLQNTRLIYWPMLINGDYDMIRPFFKMYKDALPYAEAATQHFYGHAGAFFPETMYFWGSYNLDNFGWNTSINPYLYTENQYIRYYFQGALEVAAMMLDHYHHTLDDNFAKETLLPFAHKVIQFYDEHYQRDQNGKIYIYPSQALETYWDAVNPMPPVAGLHWNVTAILELPEKLFTVKQLDFLKRIAKELPVIPKGEIEGKDVFLPAQKISGEPRNHENPEFYAIFPYRLYAVGKPELERMQNNFDLARVKLANGWSQYDVVAAFLGRTEQAKEMLVNRATPQDSICRFPAFWGPNWDWTPDQDHGSNILICLQAMLIQTKGDSILLFPTWHKEWDVEFKLHAPQQTIIEGIFKKGQIKYLRVTPKRRKKDIMIVSDQIK